MCAKRLMTPWFAVLLMLLAAAPAGAQDAPAGTSDAHEVAAAQVDADGDGLDDAREVEMGTDPADPDSDDDGLLNGEDVDTFGTDPTLLDTDGDTIDDGTEVAAGSDPTDPVSTPANPAPGSDLLVTKATCPPGYEGSDHANDCAPTEDVTFSIGFANSEFFASETTNAEGLAPFYDISAGTYVIAEDIPGDVIDRIAVFCAAPGDTEPRPLTINALNSVTVEVLAGEELSCTWYNVPVDQMVSAVEITVQAFVCPMEYSGGDFANDCDDPAEGVLVSVALDGSEFQTGEETDANGVVTFGGLSAGAYTVELGVPGDFAAFRVSCGAPGVPEGLAIDGAGTNRIGIELGEGARPTCTWYIIGENAAGFTPTPVTPTPTAATTARSAGPVSKVPDTGSGSPAGPAELGFTLMITALIGGVVGILLVARRYSRS